MQFKNEGSSSVLKINRFAMRLPFLHRQIGRQFIPSYSINENNSQLLMLSFITTDAVRHIKIHEKDLGGGGRDFYQVTNPVSDNPNNFSS
jgi:hypothetical protein